MQTTKINSHSYHVYTPQEIPVCRKLMLQTDIDTMDYRMDKKTFDSFLEAMMKDTKIEDIKRKITIVQELRKLDLTYSPIINVACNFILIDDEPLKKIDSDYLVRKKEICKHDPEVNAFFLSNGASLLIASGSLSNISNASEFLKQMKLSSDLETIVWDQINQTFFPT